MNSATSRLRLFFGEKMTFRQLMTRSIGLGALVGAPFLGFFALDGQSSQPELPGPTVLPVEVAPIKAVSSFSQRRTFTGVVKAARTSELGFERTGRLVSIEVQEGERVTAGQVLARLDDQNLRAKQRELTARRAAAQSLLDELEAGPRVQTIEAARAEVADLESQVELAKLNFQRREELLASRAISREDYDRTALGMKSTAARLDAAKSRLDELEAGTRVETIESQRAVVEQLAASIADVAVDIEESKLTAPFAGVVGKRHLDEGTIVAPGATLLRLVEDRHLEAWIGLPVHLAARMESDSSVQLLIDGTTAPAQLQTVLPELDPATRTRTAIFKLESADTSYPGQVVRIDVRDEAQAEGFWLPATSLARGSRGLWSVLVAEPRDDDTQVAAKRDVEVLYTDGERVLVRGTLDETDQVILSGTHRVVAGQQVIGQPETTTDATTAAGR